MIVFQNDGLLDTRALTTFGMSAKEGDNPIGYFGTGMKYALAVLLRTGHTVEVRVGIRHFLFTAELERFRNTEFRRIVMSEWGEKGDAPQTSALPYTTELGKDWEVWQAYRELYCNCIDENGGVFEGKTSKHDSGRDMTTITVDGTQFTTAHHQRADFILERDDKPLLDHPLASVYTNSCPSVFYRGMRIMKSDRPTMYTWNLLQQIDLTEDRTVKYEFQLRNRMADVVTSSTNKEFIEDMITADPDGVFEGNLDYGMATVVTQEFKDTVRKCMHESAGNVNKSAMKRAQVSVMELLPVESTTKLDRVDQKRLDQAVSFCHDIGFPVDEYPIILVDHIDVGIVGLAANGRIYLTKHVFNRGTKYVAGTLLEEFIHLRHKLDDETRGLQDFLVDTVIGLGERITGEPL